MGCFDCDELQFHYGEGCDACIDSLVNFVPKNCMASKSCELACALRHSTSGDINAAICEYPRPLSRLTIEQGDGKLHLITCHHCKRPKCVEACPFGAIQIHGYEVVKCDLSEAAAELSCVLPCKCGALIYRLEA